MLLRSVSNHRLPTETGAPRGSSTANRLVLMAALPASLVLGLLICLTFQFASNERNAQSGVRHSYQVIGQLGRILGDAQDAETGQRGFLLTHDPNFLAPFRTGRSQIEIDLGIFRALTRDNPKQQERARLLEQLVRARLSAFDSSLSTTEARPQATTPTLLAALQEGKRRMDALRQQVGQGMFEERRLLDERERDRRQTEDLEIGFSLCAGVLTLVILLLAAALLVRNNFNLAQAEKALSEEAAILRATLETMREGIAYFAADGTLRAYNRGLFTLLDLPQPSGQQHRTLADFKSLERPTFATIFEPPKPKQDNTAIHVSWADRELEVYKATVATGGFLIDVKDVTERLRAEATARQAQKMEAIGHLTGGVAHDFNNLLQIISANLDLAVSSTAVQADARLLERLKNAIGAVARGARLTGQLLAFARRQPLEPKSVDLGRVIRDMSDLLRRTLGETIQVETVIAGGLWSTLVDPSQVENTVLNLAINARDAMPDGGKLTLEVANAFLDDAYASAQTDVSPGQYVMLAVTDTGEGMPPQVMSRVFEPFFTTKPEGKGTGLGLAQAYGFVKQSGGHIKVYSEVGHGTTLKLYLPRTRRAADVASDARTMPVKGGHEHILVVEDDEGVRGAVVDMLKELGYQVSCAENAERALALLQTQAPDLIFTDVVMPGEISTRDFTRRARAMRPGTRILYTSGYTQNAIVHNGKLDEDAQLLSKPYRKDELARKLRSVFAGTARGAILDRGIDKRRGKVLVVEDVALIRMTTVDMVVQLGFEALEAGDADEALTLLQQDAGIAILLTDLGLPGMNGRQLVEEALRLKPDLKVVIASGYSTQGGEGADVGGASYLVKPFDLEQLRQALES
jgi:signal transduction histidine kinase/CheY-like chemotaxis protein/CHASE3 domain sensor protein